MIVSQHIAHERIHFLWLFRYIHYKGFSIVFDSFILFNDGERIRDLITRSGFVFGQRLYAVLFGVQQPNQNQDHVMIYLLDGPTVKRIAFFFNKVLHHKTVYTVY